MCTNYTLLLTEMICVVDFSTFGLTLNLKIWLVGKPILRKSATVFVQSHCKLFCEFVCKLFCNLFNQFWFHLSPWTTGHPPNSSMIFVNGLSPCLSMSISFMHDLYNCFAILNDFGSFGMIRSLSIDRNWSCTLLCTVENVRTRIWSFGIVVFFTKFPHAKL